MCVCACVRVCVRVCEDLRVDDAGDLLVDLVLADDGDGTPESAHEQREEETQERKEANDEGAALQGGHAMDLLRVGERERSKRHATEPKKRKRREQKMIDRRVHGLAQAELHGGERGQQRQRDDCVVRGGDTTGVKRRKGATPHCREKKEGGERTHVPPEACTGWQCRRTRRIGTGRWPGS